MHIQLGNMTIPEEMLKERPCDCGYDCGTDMTSDFAYIFSPTGCEIEAACADCSPDTECNEGCYYYEWSLLKAIKDASGKL